MTAGVTASGANAAVVTDTGGTEGCATTGLDTAGAGAAVVAKVGTVTGTCETTGPVALATVRPKLRPNSMGAPAGWTGSAGRGCILLALASRTALAFSGGSFCNACSTLTAACGAAAG